MITKALKPSFLILFMLIISSTGGQDVQKNLSAIRTPIAPKIDGKLDEPQWQDAEAAGDFIQYAPYNAAKPSQPTVVKIMYDDRAIYVGAMMYDSHPDSIYRELGERDDDDINADFFTIDITPYNDGLNAFEFKVSASGVEVDTKHAANYRDKNWDPIWKSAVEINDSGWVAEMEIPYAAIRFPKTEEQIWGINMWRNIRRHREWSTWNYIDNTLDGVFNQSGTLTGIRDIKPPLRLFFIPYVAGYTEKI
ncbi:MAG: carbohydrate binding family 9 domain-containing protein, partial [Bacteroidetes bacterium]|nr:carbohydrate binding family 9 domain-containing protein [Bacteroidota bacterium]